MIKTAQLTEGLSHTTYVIRDENAENHCRQLETYDLNRPVFLVLGGESTMTDRIANGYIKHAEKVVKESGVDPENKTQFIGAVYHYDKQDQDWMRTLQMNEHGEGKKLDSLRSKIKDSFRRKNDQYSEDIYQEINQVVDEYNTDQLRDALDVISDKNYVKEIYETFMAPRIKDENGEKLPVEEAQKRMRLLNFGLHCHGGYVFQELETMAHEDMQRLGYSEEEQKKIMKEVFVLAQSPYCHLEKPETTMVSFSSGHDDQVAHNTPLVRLLQKNALLQEESQQYPMIYFEEESLMHVSQVIEDMEGYKNTTRRLSASDNKDNQEHEFFPYSNDEIMPYLTSQGKASVLMMRRAIKSAIESSVNGTKLPPVEELLLPSEQQSFIEKIKDSGRKVMNFLNTTKEARFIPLEKKDQNYIHIREKVQKKNAGLSVSELKQIINTSKAQPRVLKNSEENYQETQRALSSVIATGRE